MFQMIALGLEGIVVLVLDLPASAARAEDAATFSSVILKSVIKPLR